MEWENLRVPTGTTMEAVRPRVTRGAERLDAFEAEAASKGHPASSRWFECIDLGTLEISCPDHGILGQLFGPRDVEDYLRRMLMGMPDGTVVGAAMLGLDAIGI